MKNTLVAVNKLIIECLIEKKKEGEMRMPKLQSTETTRMSKNKKL